MKKEWEELKKISENLENMKLDEWMSEFTQLSESIISDVLQKASYQDRKVIMQILTDISEACVMRDRIRLQDAVSYGFLTLIEKYCMEM